MTPYPAPSDKESAQSEGSNGSPDVLARVTIFTPVYGTDVEMAPGSHARLTKTLNNYNLAMELKRCDSGIIGFKNGDNTNSKTKPTLNRHVYPHWRICFHFVLFCMLLSCYASVIMLEQI